MAAPQINYQGVTLTDRFLTVCFVIEVGATIRFASVKIPVGDLASVGVVPAIDKHVRAQLQVAWDASAAATQQEIPW